MRCGLDRGGGSGWSVGDRLGGSRRRSAGFGSGSSGLGLGLVHHAHNETLLLDVVGGDGFLILEDLARVDELL